MTDIHTECTTKAILEGTVSDLSSPNQRNCTTAKVDTVEPGKFQAACISDFLTMHSYE